MNLNKSAYKRKFRALVRLVSANVEWLIEGMTFDKELHSVAEALIRHLTLEHKTLLNKSPDKRNEDEKRVLYKIVTGLRGFIKYSDTIKSLLSRSTIFNYIRPGRVIMRKNQLSFSMYFVVDGLCEVTEIDTTLEKKYLKPGHMFGAKSLFLCKRRPFTVTSFTPLQLLTLRIEVCDDYSRELIKQEWLHMDVVINKISYFDTWDIYAKTEFCLIGKIKSFNKGDIVLGDGYGSGSLVYFLLKGKCQVIEHLLVNTKVVNGIKKYELYKRQEDTKLSDGMGRNYGSRRSLGIQAASVETAKTSSFNFSCFVETHFMQVLVYSEMACFGLGENMDRRRIVALTDVQILNVPRYWLYETGDPNIWYRIRRYLDKNTPNTEMVFRSFMSQKKWRRYCKEFTSSFIHKEPCNTINNIPYSIRMDQDLDFLQN